MTPLRTDAGDKREVPNQRRRHAGSRPGRAARAPRRLVVLPVAGAVLTLLLSAASVGAFERLTQFLDFGAGVLSLVCLTGTVLWGLAATDRWLLGSPHRLLAQGVHRGLAVAGLGFLTLHIGVKVAESRTSAAAAALPFADGSRPVLIGLGTVAAYLFLAVAVSGAVRGTFAARGSSRYWRALHMCAYPAWCAALVHGLKAGRAAAGWVTVSYALCLLGVAAALVLRVLARSDSPPSGATSRWLPWLK
ncbi:hypothetical protein GL263_20860 [Streptomyces durbertensis]|uniref:Integral membrane protein n=1 Tax=Streptomyces durbertensis TaxID=2448886 RepID=A0ABR6ELG9_9ACTN|nr:hypothetical protein [Streptomyces durbertensis]MBB1245983.1 hypothetical protein [Streptomyces durbertensis]